VAIWTEDELKREEVRAIFALGVFAIIFGFYQTAPVRGLFESGSDNLTPLFNVVIITLVYFWALYILLVAVSMMEWTVGRKQGQILKLAKQFGQAMFGLGILVSAFLIVVVGTIIFYQTLTTNPTSFVGGFLSLIVVVPAYMMGRFMVHRMRHRKR
jgi:hypothetical protein